MRGAPRILLPLAALAIAIPAHAQDPTVRVDRVFQSWNTQTSPGCAVEVARNGRSVLARAYGMADLEHDIPNRVNTIFEAGSVSKQFTAAAIMLLAQDGRLSLDDDIRKYVPEVPDYGSTIRIRHLLNHTSGLRDWGSVAAIGGWGREARTHTHDHVLDIISKQRALNFEPGHEYSYSNSGYNLLAIIVDRVAGEPFAEFSRKRIFEPLGLSNTQWRDDYRRIVKGRSSAYAFDGGTWVIDRPIENVHGNGGLLTTVGDLLKWNEALQTGAGLGGRAFVDEMHRRGVLNSGDTISYASGLVVDSYYNIPEVSHTGATSGYRAFLARYPEQNMAIAVLCNTGNANPGSLGHLVADAFLGDAVRRGEEEPRPAPAQTSSGERFTPTPQQLAEYAGTFRSDEAETSFTVRVEDGSLTLERRPDTKITLRPLATERDTFVAGGLGRVRFIRGPGGGVTHLSVSQGRVYDLRFERVSR